MEYQCLEVNGISSQEGLCQKHPAPPSDKGLCVCKRLPRNSPPYSMEWENYPPPDRTTETEEIQPERETLKPSPQRALSLQQDPSLIQSTHQRKKKVQQNHCKTSYNPYNFTSDELDPAYQWPVESSSAKKCGVDVIPLLRSTVGPFPLGLRLDKLEMMVWNKHKVKLCKMSLEYGYEDSLRFLESVPGINIKFPSKRTSQCLVQ